MALELSDIKQIVELFTKPLADITTKQTQLLQTSKDTVFNMNNTLREQVIMQENMKKDINDIKEKFKKQDKVFTDNKTTFEDILLEIYKILKVWKERGRVIKWIIYILIVLGGLAAGFKVAFEIFKTVRHLSGV